MCGITGIIHFGSNKNPDTSFIQKMTKSIRHRGPDGEGYLLAGNDNYICVFSDDTPPSCRNQSYTFSPTINLQNVTEHFPVQLGHRRLSVIDLSPAGHQPMCSSDARFWITYNGEIYNYIELREELRQLGFSFSTQTDTEVILKAYEQWGKDCVNRFNGMWAFVIYDRKNNLLFGSRDRFGVKPLYYFRNEKYFAFASEQKALLQLPFVEHQVNAVALFDFFALNKVETEEEGLFKSIFELHPSHSFTLNVNNGDFHQWKYYQLKWNNRFENYRSFTSTDYISTVRRLLQNAIELRLRSDAPVGTCLSGGIDSSTIVCVVNELMKGKNYNQLGAKQSAFTASFNDSRFDESAWAKTVVNQTQVKWHRTFPNADEFLKDIEQLMYGHDVPIWSTSSYAQYKVMKLAKESGIKVLLDGQGGDELFGGYKHYQLNLLQEYRINSDMRAYHNERKHFNEMNGKGFLPKLVIKNWIISSAPLSLKKLFFNDLQFINPEILNQYRERWELTKENPSSLNDSLQQDFAGNHLKELLLREDRNAMIHSVESRTPFADDLPLIEFLFSIPGVYKIRNAQTKFLLRESVKDILPQEVYLRSDKMGFSTPNNKWLSEHREQFHSYFNSSMKDYINLKLLNKHYDSFFNNPDKPENYRTFKFVSFAIWMNVFNMK